MYHKFYNNKIHIVNTLSELLTILTAGIIIVGFVFPKTTEAYKWYILYEVHRLF